MNKILFVLLAFLLSACGSKLEGTYSNNMTGVAEQKMSFTFKPDGTARMSIGSSELPMEIPYEVSGNTIKLSGAQGVQIITILDDGDLIMNGLRLKKETVSKLPAVDKISEATPEPAIAKEVSHSPSSPASMREINIKGNVAFGQGNYEFYSPQDQVSYSFDPDSEHGKRILSECEEGVTCQLTGEVDSANSRLVSVRQIKKVTP